MCDQSRNLRYADSILLIKKRTPTHKQSFAICSRRFTHFMERFENHKKSLAMEAGPDLNKKIEVKKDQLRKFGYSLESVTALDKAVEVLRDCREILKNTYVQHCCYLLACTLFVLSRCLHHHHYDSTKMGLFAEATPFHHACCNPCSCFYYWQPLAALPSCVAVCAAPSSNLLPYCLRVWHSWQCTAPAPSSKHLVELDVGYANDFIFRTVQICLWFLH